jgi:small neutral amino acid transporter SnatA (MarC family)
MNLFQSIAIFAVVFACSYLASWICEWAGKTSKEMLASLSGVLVVAVYLIGSMVISRSKNE